MISYIGTIICLENHIHHSALHVASKSHALIYHVDIDIDIPRPPCAAAVIDAHRRARVRGPVAAPSPRTNGAGPGRTWLIVLPAAVTACARGPSAIYEN